MRCSYSFIQDQLKIILGFYHAECCWWTLEEWTRRYRPVSNWVSPVSWSTDCLREGQKPHNAQQKCTGLGIESPRYLLLNKQDRPWIIWMLFSFTMGTSKGNLNTKHCTCLLLGFCSRRQMCSSYGFIPVLWNAQRRSIQLRYYIHVKYRCTSSLALYMYILYVYS
jgi:hypothetical protein